LESLPSVFESSLSESFRAASLERGAFKLLPLVVCCASDFDFVVVCFRCFFGDGDMLVELVDEVVEPELDDAELLLLPLLELLSEDALLVESVRCFLFLLSSAVFHPLCCRLLSFSDPAKSFVLCWDLDLDSALVFWRSLVPESSAPNGDRLALSLFDRSISFLA